MRFWFLGVLAVLGILLVPGVLGVDSIGVYINGTDVTSAVYNVTTNEGLTGSLFVNITSSINGTATIQFNTSNYSVPYYDSNAGTTIYTKIIQIPGNLNVGIYEIIANVSNTTKFITLKVSKGLLINDTEGPDYVSGENNTVVNNATNVSFNFWDPSNVTNVSFSANVSNANWTSGINTTNASLTMNFPVNASQVARVDVNVTDGWNNTEAYVFFVTVDLDAPNITGLNVSKNGTWVGPVFNVSVNVSDISNASCWVEMNGTNVPTTANGTGVMNITANASNLSSGNYTLSVECVDGVGNKGNASLNVSLDNTKPTITWISPSYSITNNTWIFANVSVTDNESGVKGCNLTLNNGSSYAMANSNNYYYKNVSLTDGDWTLEVECKDNVGNDGSTSKNVTVDTIAPSIAYSWSSTNSSVTVNVSVNDTHLNYTLVELGSQNCNNTSASFTCVFNGLDNNKNYTVRITSYDSAGNQADVSFNASTKANPIASFTATPTSGYAPLTVVFNASQSYDPDGTITSYAWDLGDSTTGTGQAVNHTYTNAGVYTVTLTVTDNDNYTASMQVSITASKKSSHSGGGGGGGSYWVNPNPPTPKPEKNVITNKTETNNDITKSFLYDKKTNTTKVTFKVYGTDGSAKYIISDKIPDEVVSRILGIIPNPDETGEHNEWVVWLSSKTTFTIEYTVAGYLEPEVFDKWEIVVNRIEAKPSKKQKQVKESKRGYNESKGRKTLYPTTGFISLEPPSLTGIVATILLGALFAAGLRVKEELNKRKKFPLKYKGL